MFTKLFTKLFGTTNHDSDKLRAKDINAGTMQTYQPKRRVQSQPKVSGQINRGMQSAADANRARYKSAKTNSHWAQPSYSGGEPISAQQHLSMLYAPHVGPINGKTEVEDTWCDFRPLPSNKERILGSYLTKATQQIADAEPISAPASLEEIKVPLRSTAEILFEISTTPDVKVRECIAANERTPVRALWALSDDESPMVKAKIISNAHCPTLLLELLSTDSDQQVAKLAANALYIRGTSKDAA